MSRALITGIAGQDGSYLAEQLLADGFEVHGTTHRSLVNIEHLRDRVELHAPDTLAALIADLRPAEIYHLAAPSFVPDSWRDPAGTIAAIAGACASLLEAVRGVDCAVVIAGSREMFGATDSSPQDERSVCRPTSPYGVAKLAAHQLVGVLRARYGLRASSAILYNHESPRRPERFVTRRVTRAAAAISLGLETELVLGDLDAVRDWSAAQDMTSAMRLMARSADADDYVLASGHGRTVRELVDTAFACVGLRADDQLRVDAQLVRSAEVVAPIGNSAKAHERLGWRPQWSFEELIAEMVRRDRELLSA
jgi:GDPmannose 4,6-dehydratase